MFNNYMDIPQKMTFSSGLAVRPLTMVALMKNKSFVCSSRNAYVSLISGSKILLKYTKNGQVYIH